MTEPLSRDRFEEWRKDELVPHILAEATYEKKVDTLEQSIQRWLQVVSVGFGAVVTVGGMLFSLFFWVLNEKNTQILEMSRSIQLLSERQQVVLSTIAQYGDEFERLRKKVRITSMGSSHGYGGWWSPTKC